MTNFDNIARIIRDHIGFDSGDLCVNGGGRYIRFQLRAVSGGVSTSDHKHGVGIVTSIGANGRDAEGKYTFRQYTLPEPLRVAAGSGVTADVPDFREFVAALRCVGLRTNDSDYPGEAPLLDEGT